MDKGDIGLVFFLTGMVVGLVLGNWAGTSQGRAEERETWCRHQFELLEDFEQCKEKGVGSDAID